MDDRTLWKLMREAGGRIQERYDPSMESLVAKSDISLREWMLLLAALTFEPDDTTPSHLMVRGPYTSSDRYLEGLENAHQVGYLDKVASGRYRLSESGKSAVEEFIKVVREVMADTALLPEGELSDLAQLLGRLVETCLATPSPPDTWSITLSYKLMPTIEPSMPYIEQAISCLSAYRDDAHLASWCASGISASGMECLTLIWRDQAQTYMQLVNKLRFRGHPDEVYLDAIAELKARNYLTGSRNNLSITEKGTQFREQVEINTDRYFYHPWKSLTADEKQRIATQLPKI